MHLSIADYTLLPHNSYLVHVKDLTQCSQSVMFYCCSEQVDFTYNAQIKFYVSYGPQCYGHFSDFFLAKHCQLALAYRPARYILF